MGSPEPEKRPDVVDVLTAEHRQLASLVSRLQAGGPDRAAVFEQLVHDLAVHEAAEEMLVHPTARRAVFGADNVVRPRLDEEHAAKRALAHLYDLGVDGPEFDRALDEFAVKMAQHAAQEEQVEFPLLRKQFSAAKLENMAASLETIESLAPTRPHPHAGDTALANVFAGPPLAVFDRIRDAVRDYLHTQRQQGGAPGRA